MVNYEIINSQKRHNHCWHCTDRVAGCHIHCEKYAEMVAENKRFNEAMRIEKLIDYHPYGKSAKTYHFIPKRRFNEDS